MPASTDTAPLSTDATIELFDDYVIANYRRFPVSLVRGEGSRVWDSEGREYLDLFPGWGCNLLGHCPPRVVEAVQRQAATLIHVPNTWYTEQQGRWAEMLSTRTAFGGQAFFCNSGTEANEAAIKLARLATPPERYKIITFTGGFHGRTLGSLTATAQPKYHEGLGPLVAGFTYCPFGDIEAVRAAVDESTAAILLEPIQGEGGVRIPPEGFLAELREIADQNELLLIFDEVQTGCGRTGQWFGHQYFNVTPDIITLAKSLCAGVAGGAMLARPEVATSLRPGTHAATFGGNPIAAAAGIAMIETIEAEGLLERAQQISQRLVEGLQAMAEQFEFVREVRAVGLMLGLELEIEGSSIVEECMRQGLLLNCTQQTTLRLLPAMNLSDEEADRGLEILRGVLERAEGEPAEV
ncbi:aspartate aminotransferase family protein [Candidatus Laterigemmans baculatus]|uniref:aspartate aminotransferase family protein n=1 Tax=Candidatus Laterigemmans baculatus TaxID=2770505 RepID=UPI0013DBF756|nr:aspartate aminotransferase family protein [Candidatus Laterigemmans baculatus]